MSNDSTKLDLWLQGAATAIGIEIQECDREAVIAQLELNRSLIAPLLDFEIPITDVDNTK